MVDPLSVANLKLDYTTTRDVVAKDQQDVFWIDHCLKQDRPTNEKQINWFCLIQISCR